VFGFIALAYRLAACGQRNPRRYDPDSVTRREKELQMELRVRLPAVAIAMTIVALIGCRKSETSSSGGSAAPGQPPAAVESTPDSHPPLVVLDTPREGSAVPNKSWGTGWALDDSGIFQVTATADNGAVVPARIGLPFPGVKEAYPNMPDNDKAGFIFGVPDLPPGPHTLKVEIVAKDGGKVVLTRNFKIG